MFCGIGGRSYIPQANHLIFMIHNQPDPSPVVSIMEYPVSKEIHF